MDLELLKQPLPKEAIKTRKQGGVSLSYIEGYHAIETANRIFGFGQWSKTIDKLHCVHTKEREKNNKKQYNVFYTAQVSISLPPESADGYFFADYQDVGYGSGISYAGIGEAHELASKEAVTDAMKRALRHFGDQFGNCLYNKDFTPVSQEAAQAPVASSKPTKAKEGSASLPAMTSAQKTRMGRIWKFVNDNMNPDGSIKPEDISVSTYATLTHWPDSATDEETIINSIQVTKT